MLPVGDDSGGQRGLPWITLVLIVLNALVYLFETQLSMPDLNRLVHTWGMIPAEIERGRDLHTLITSMFVHGSFAHIFSNMLFLWIFGDNIERRLGRGLYLAFYLGTGIAASIAHIATNMGAVIPTVGASGAISGILGAYLVFYPRNRVRMLVGFFGYYYVRAYVFIGGWFALQLFSGLMTLNDPTVQMSGVAFWAHIGGFVAGVLVTLIVRPFRPAPRRAPFALWQDGDRL